MPTLSKRIRSRARMGQTGRTPSQEIGHLMLSLNGQSSGSLERRLQNIFFTRYLYFFARKIHQAFKVKSDGGTDELGLSWKPLAPATIAARVPPKSGERGLLTKAQNARWKGIFAGHLNRLRRQGAAEPQAKAEAARIAWGVLKAQGAKTRIGTLSKRNVAILNKSGRLERALRPGSLVGFASNSNPELRFKITGRSTAEYQILVPYVKYHQQGRGVPRRMVIPPARRLGPWQLGALTEATAAVRDRIAEIVARG